MDHVKVMNELDKNFRPVLENSEDGVYLWLDEENMICNERFARLLGYSVKEIENAPPFLDTFVAEKDQERFSRHYQDHIANLSSPIRFRFRAVKKDGRTIPLETDMIPITFMNHAIAYHFVRPIEA